MSTSFLPGTISSGLLRVRFAFGVDPRSDPSGWTWTDVTNDVLQDAGRKIQITVARSGAENDAAPPAHCSLALDNRSAAYTQYSAKSQYYPNVREGTPMWVEIDPGTGTFHTRFFGYVKGFAPQWDTSGNYAITQVDAYGVTRRLTQGSAPLRSALYRATTLGGGALVAYWPLEDGALSTRAASGLAGVQDGTINGAVNLGSTAGPTGSAPLADFSPGGQAVFTVNAPISAEYRVEMLVQFPVLDTGDQVIGAQFTFEAGAGDLQTYQIQATPNAAGGITWEAITAPPSPAATVIVTDFGVDAQWHWLTCDFYIDTGQLTVELAVDDIQTGTVSLGAINLPRLAKIVVNPTNNPNGNAPAVGHVLVWSNRLSSRFQWANGNAGEAPNDRLARLCSEQGEVFSPVGTYSPVVTMGGQGIDSLINLLRECETADDGFLYDGLSQGLQYRGLVDRYNASIAMTLDASAGQVQPPWQPIPDDLGRVNDMTVTRTNGGSSEYVQTDGPLGTGNVGTYSNSLTVNTETDGPLDDRAAWEVKLGTIAGYRYGALKLNLRRDSSKIASWLAVVPGSTISITPPYSTQLETGTIYLIVEGWVEELSKLTWDVTQLNCSVADFLQHIGVYATSVSSGTSHYDAENSTVHTAFNTTATSLSIDSAANTTLWTTDSNAFPFDVLIGGERMTVSGISGSSSPQTFTITTRHVNGVTKSHSIGEAVTLADPVYYALA